MGTTLETASPKKQSPSKPNSHPIAAVTTFSGPVPPPEFLRDYEILVPGSAKRFLEAPHLEAEHRRALELAYLEEKIKLSRKGQWMAFSLAVLSIVAAFTAIFLGYSLAGVGTFFIAVGSIVGLFIYGKKTEKLSAKEPENRQKLNP
jgi:uncharacterized membrane protein